MNIGYAALAVAFAGAIGGVILAYGFSYPSALLQSIGMVVILCTLAVAGYTLSRVRNTWWIF